MRPKRRILRKGIEVAFVALFMGGILVSLGVLAILLGAILTTAWSHLTPALVLNWASSTDPSRAGYAPAIVGTIWVLGLTLLFSLPLGIGAGIYLEEYAGKSRISKILQAGVSNLAGVPSVVFGLLGLALFVRAFGLGPVILAGALTLTILVFPYVVITAQEAIRAVPQTIRDAALAMGATKWQSIRHQVLPAAAPGLLTASILAAARAIGETAPLIVIGAAVFITFLPDEPTDRLVALPVQIYSYIGLSDPGFQSVAAGGMIILLGVLFLFNAVAIVARSRLQRMRW
jgi:phosphate transport system permease protein